MDERRRRLLAALGTAGVGALGGCTGNGDGTEGQPDDTTTPPDGTDEPTPTLIRKLAADDGDAGDAFGSSVSVAGDGTAALVGAPTDEGNLGEAAGGAYAYERSEGEWTYRAKLAADDGDSRDRFGSSVAVAGDGTTAIIGAPNDEDPNGDGAGAAYVFERPGNWWRERAKLAAADGDADDSFGISVAVSGDGDTVLVASYDDDPNGDQAGAVYVFERNGEAWPQQAKLVADDGDAGDLLGTSVSVSDDGTTALVGAAYDEDPNGTEAGAVYVFERSGGAWTQGAKLTAGDGDSTDHFGFSVAVSGDGTAALVGAPNDEDPNGEAAGAAYAFERTGDGWTERAKLAADDGDADDFFGLSVAVSRDATTAIVGASNDEDPNGSEAGAAYVFDLAGGEWTQRAKFAPDDGDAGDDFGIAVDLTGDGSTSLVGARLDEDPNGTNAGAAYLFSV